LASRGFVSSAFKVVPLLRAAEAPLALPLFALAPEPDCFFPCSLELCSLEVLAFADASALAEAPGACTLWLALALAPACPG